MMVSQIIQSKQAQKMLETGSDFIVSVKNVSLCG